jgi:hypothetical protein
MAWHSESATAGTTSRIELTEPYEARPVNALGTYRIGDWRLKEYTIAYRRETARPELVEAAEAAAASMLPAPAVTPTRYGVGFLGIHDGRGGGLVFVDWWEQENELHHHVLLSAEDDLAALRPATAEEMTGCVWDLGVVAYERESWLRHVFAADVLDLDAYLADQLDGRI